MDLHAPKAPLSGELSPKVTDEVEAVSVYPLCR